MKKHFRSLTLIAMLIVLALGAVCSAESGNEDALNIQAVSVTDAGTMDLLIYSSNPDLKPNDVQLQLGGTAFGADSVTPYKEGTSWIFLVDTAYVAANAGKEPIIGTIQELIRNMGENDNAALLTTGDTDKMIDLIQNRDALSDMIGSARLDKGTTNLNATIAAALDFLSSGENVRRHAVLVILSNGENGDEIGMSMTELMRKVENATVTVYPVAYVRKGASTSNLDRYSSLATASRGGISIQQEQDDWNATSILSVIANNEAHFYTLATNPAAAQAVGATVIVNDGVENSMWTLSESEQQLLASYFVPPTATAGDGEQIPSEAFPLMLILIVGGAALALIVALIIVIVRTRKKRSREDEDTSCPDEPPVVPHHVDEILLAEEDPYGGRSAQCIQLMLSQVNGGSARYNVEMTGEELAVGRDPSRAGLVIRDDLKISGMHLVLRYDHNMMMVEDFSRNGTKVNGNRIDRPTVLHQQDVLTLGATQLRISWRIKP